LLRALIGRRWADRHQWRNVASCIQPTNTKNTALHQALQSEAGFPIIDLEQDWQVDQLAERVDCFCATDYNDAALQKRILNNKNTAFLYTNGGIVPGVLLTHPGVRIIHIHPGIVPAMRGSDCLLWSVLMRGRIGVSCFYMGVGIDDGAIIGQQEFPLPNLPSLSPLLTADREREAYRALLYAVDPHYRAKLLVNVLRQYMGTDLRALPTQQQASPIRPAYLWMHPRLRLKTMRETLS